MTQYNYDETFASSSDADCDTIELPIVPVADALIGTTSAENWKHTIARTALLNELCSDERVEQIWQKWGHWTGLNDTFVRLAKSLEVLAKAGDLPNRGVLVNVLEKGSAIEKERLYSRWLENLDCEQVGCNLYECEQVNEAGNVFADLFDLLDRIDLEPVSNDAVEIVRTTWNLPWPWLSVELLRMFLRGGIGFSIGQIMRSESWAEDKIHQAPKIERVFKTEPENGETIVDAFRKLNEFYVDIFERLDRVGKADKRAFPLGRFPSEPKGVERINRNVNWFYKNHFRGESIRSLSRNYHDEVHPSVDSVLCDDRSTIRAGIKEAKRLLDLTQYRY